MPISVRELLAGNGAYSGTNTNSLTLTTGANTAVGDLLVFFVMQHSRTASAYNFPAPSSANGAWTNVLQAPAGPSANCPVISVWRRVATVAGAQTVTITLTGSFRSVNGFLYVLSGADTVVGGSTRRQNTSSDVAIPSISSALADDLLLSVVGRSYRTPPPTLLSPVDSIIGSSATANDGVGSQATGRDTITAAGSTGTRTGTTGDADLTISGAMVLVRPSAVSGGDKSTTLVRRLEKDRRKTLARARTRLFGRLQAKELTRRFLSGKTRSLALRREVDRRRSLGRSKTTTLHQIVEQASTHKPSSTKVFVLGTVRETSRSGLSHERETTLLRVANVEGPSGLYRTKLTTLKRVSTRSTLHRLMRSAAVVLTRVRSEERLGRITSSKSRAIGRARTGETVGRLKSAKDYTLGRVVEKSTVAGLTGHTTTTLRRVATRSSVTGLSTVRVTTLGRVASKARTRPLGASKTHVIGHVHTRAVMAGLLGEKSTTLGRVVVRSVPRRLQTDKATELRRVVTVSRTRRLTTRLYYIPGRLKANGYVSDLRAGSLPSAPSSLKAGGHKTKPSEMSAATWKRYLQAGSRS